MNFITTISRLISRLFVKESPMTDPVQPAVAGTAAVAQPVQPVQPAVVHTDAVQAQPVVADPSVEQLKAEVAALKAGLAKVEPARQKFVELLKSVGHDVELVADEAWALAKKAI